MNREEQDMQRLHDDWLSPAARFLCERGRDEDACALIEISCRLRLEAMNTVKFGPAQPADKV